MAEATFDVEAKIPEGAPAKSVNEMLQALLEERFGLVQHGENKEVAGFALVVGKNGPKLKPAAPPDPEAAKPKGQAELMAQLQKNMKSMQSAREAMPPGTPGESWSRWGNPAATMEDLANHLEGVVHRPVVDMTSLEGKYDVRLEMRWPSDGAPESGVSSALAEMGLKAEPRKISVTTIVVDKISKTLTEN